MVKNEKGNVLCRNAKGKEHYLSPIYIANKALMERYGWEIVEEPQAPSVSVDKAISESDSKASLSEELSQFQIQYKVDNNLSPENENPADVVAAISEPIEPKAETPRRGRKKKLNQAA